MAFATTILLEVALRLAAPLDRDLSTMLYMPGVEQSYDDVETLEALMRRTVLGWVPQRERCGFVLNSRSFRTREYAQPLDASRRRLVTLGDSFNFDSNGVAYELMISASLEADLRQAWGESVDVFGLGVPGVGTRFQRRVWQLEKKLLQPETVVLMFFVGNDLTDEVRLGRRHRLSQWLARVSYGFRLVRNLQRRPHLVPPAADAKQPSGGYSVAGSDYGNLVLSRDQLVGIEAQRLTIALSERADILETLATSSAEVLEAFRDDVEATGARFLVLLIPDVFQVDQTLRSEAAARLGVNLGDVVVDAPQNALIRHFEARGIDYLDLLPDFRAATSRGQELYWPYDTHWNSAGHSLAGELLAGHLLEPAASPASR